jgi:succinate dehydrogenase/fumarate reductase flavoprotein subunit
MARTLGINPFTGWSINACTWSGYTAGESAARYAQEHRFREIDFSYLHERHRIFLEPLRSESGVDPDQLVYDLQTILFPVDILIIMSEPKLKQALEGVIWLKEDAMPRLRAKDVRTLVKSKEAQTMVLSAEMALRGALMRKETRENIFYRDDYPVPDNENWLNWITVGKNSDGTMDFRTEAVPFERYKFKPDSQAPRSLFGS